MEQFWYDKPADLFNKDYAVYFFPNEKMTFAQKLNSILRLSVYFAVVMIIITSNFRYMLAPLIVAVVTYLLYVRVPAKKSTLRSDETYDGFDQKVCTKPTKENPFMNVLMSEYKQDPERHAACDLDDGKVKALANSHFESNLFRSITDIFGKEASDRQYYTTPSTTIPNDQGGFARWLYGGTRAPSYGPTCKEPNGGVQCALNMGMGAASPAESTAGNTRSEKSHTR